MTTAPHLDSTKSSLMWDRFPACLQAGRSGRSFCRQQSRLTDWKVRPKDFFNGLRGRRRAIRQTCARGAVTTS